MSSDGQARQTPARPADISWVDLARESKPIVCALNGVAVGLGITLPLSCDVRLAAEDARISFRFLRIGLTPEYGSTHFLGEPGRAGASAGIHADREIHHAQEAKDAGS